MQQFSIYHAVEGLFNKTICLLVEKSYLSSFRIIVLTSDLEVQESLNKLIWTYSKKQFIPHGSKLDTLPEKQPVYITHELENPNKANVLIIVAPFNIKEIFSKGNYISHFQRVIIIYDSLDNIDLLIKTINESTESTPTIDCYKQNHNGTWSK